MINNSTSRWVKIGNVAVDSGSVLIGDPCYHIGDEKNKETTWEGFCKNYTDHFYKNGYNSPWRLGEGLLVSSGRGDGLYDVFVKRDEFGRVSELKIVFIDSEDDEDDEY